MSLQTKVIGRQPTDHGPYDPNLAYGKRFQCTLFGCAWESLHDNNNTAPAVWDGGDTITPNLVDWKKASGSYEAWLMNHDKPAASEQYPFNGMGRVRLLKNIVNGVNTLTQAMLTQQNTVYVIQYDFTLGENITVPANCVLEFDGGSISGAYTLTLNNCQIIAPNICIFKGITLAGKTNDTFNLVWLLDSDDITDAINNLPYTIKKVRFVSDNIYYVHNTVSIYDIRYLYWDATVYYNGTESDISIIKLVGNNPGALVYFNGLFRPIEQTTAVDQVNDNTDVVGLEIINSQDAVYHINGIGWFNENVRVSGLGAGCCNNKFFFDRLYCANRHLRIYQNDADGNIGWANENYFYGGHFFNFSSWKNQGKKSTAVHIEGGDNDGYDSVNALTFMNCNFEGYGYMNGYTVYAENAKYCNFINIRNEGGSYFLKAVGSCEKITIKTTFGLDTIDMSDSNSLLVQDPDSIFITDSIEIMNVMDYIKESGTNRWTSDVLTDKNGLHSNMWNSGSDAFGLCLDYSRVAGKNIILSEDYRHGSIMTFIKNDQIVTPINAKNPFPILTNNMYKSSSGSSGVVFQVPIGLDVDYIWLGVSINPYDQSNHRRFKISTDGQLSSTYRAMPTSGAYADVPTISVYGAGSLGKGQEYYCTDLGKKIMWNGSAWVNLDGSSLS